MNKENWDGETGWDPYGNEKLLTPTQANWVKQLLAGIEPELVFKKAGRKSGKTTVWVTFYTLMNNPKEKSDGTK